MAFRSRKLMVEIRGEKWCEMDETLPEVAEVGRVRLRSDQLIDHGFEVVKRGDGAMELTSLGRRDLRAAASRRAAWTISRGTWRS
jgi:hypothetical protein